MLEEGMADVIDLEVLREIVDESGEIGEYEG